MTAAANPGMNPAEGPARLGRYAPGLLKKGRCSGYGRRWAHGVAAVELAIVLGILVLVLAGATEFGRALVQYDTLTKSVRAAARYASVFDTEQDPLARGRAACLAVHGSTDCEGPPLLTGLTLAQVRVDNPITDPSLAAWPALGAQNGTLALVRVRIEGFTFRSALTGLVSPISLGTVQAHMPVGGS